MNCLKKKINAKKRRKGMRCGVKKKKQFLLRKLMGAKLITGDLRKADQTGKDRCDPLWEIL